MLQYILVFKYSNDIFTKKFSLKKGQSHEIFDPRYFSFFRLSCSNRFEFLRGF
jgi:hypothetical protein